MKTWPDRSQPCPVCAKYLDDHLIAGYVAMCPVKNRDAYEGGINITPRWDKDDDGA